jgi:hypothetical protein
LRDGKSRRKKGKNKKDTLKNRLFEQEVEEDDDEEESELPGEPEWRR